MGKLTTRADDGGEVPGRRTPRRRTPVRRFRPPTGRGRTAGTVLVAVVAILASGCLFIDTPSLAPVYVGQPAWLPLQASGAQHPLTWSAEGLPDGVAIDPGTGVIQGVPTGLPGTSPVQVSIAEEETGLGQSKAFDLEARAPATETVAAVPGEVSTWDLSTSHDGAQVAYITSAGVFVWDRTSGTTTTIAAAMAFSIDITSDGRYVAFGSAAQLLPVVDTEWNIYVWDRLSGNLTRAPGLGTRELYPQLSEDGSTVHFVCMFGATGLCSWGVEWGIDWPTYVDEPPQVVASGNILEFSMSNDGSVLAYTDYQADGGHTFVRAGGSTVEPFPTNHGGGPRVSGDGSRVAFSTVDPIPPLGVGGTYSWNRISGQLTRLDVISPMAGIDGETSDDGRYVAVGLPDGYGTSAVWDVVTGSVIGMATPGVELLRFADIAGDGRHVTYTVRVGGEHVLQQWDAAGA